MLSIAQPLPRWTQPALWAVLLLFFLCRNLPWHLDDYDQAKQAYVSYEMVQGGQWWFQHTPSGRVATKPPLAGWISAGLAAAGGQGDVAWAWAWRLPPLLGSLVILALLFRAGRELGGEAGGLLAGGAFGLNVMTPRLATLVRTDMLLCLSIFLIGYLIFAKLRNNTPWQTRDRWLLGTILLASLLLKGPIAYAFLLPGLAAFFWLQRRAPAPGQAWSGWWSWTAPLAFFGLWVGLGIYLSADFYQQVVLTEFLGRFEVGESAPHHNQPVYFYFTNLLIRFFPWSFLLLGLAAVREVRTRLRREPALLWLVCWALGGLIFMSLVPSKRADRIFSVLPPFCLLLAAAVPLLPGLIARWLTPRTVLAVLGGAVLWSGSYVAWEVIGGYREHQAGLHEFGQAVRQATSGRTLAAVSGHDEGLLLYLHLLRFTRADDAAAAWSAGTLQACVLPEGELAKRQRQFAPCQETMRTGHLLNKGSSYVLIERPEVKR